MRFRKFILLFFFITIVNSCATPYKVYQNGKLTNNLNYKKTNATIRTGNDSCLIFEQDEKVPNASSFIKELKIKNGFFSAFSNDNYTPYSTRLLLIELAKKEAIINGANAIKIKQYKQRAPIMGNAFIIVDLYKLNNQSWQEYSYIKDSLLRHHESIIHIKILKGYYTAFSINRLYYNDSLIGSFKFLKRGIPDNPLINFSVKDTGILSCISKSELDSATNAIHNKYRKQEKRHPFGNKNYPQITRQYEKSQIDYFKSINQTAINRLGKEYFIHLNYWIDSLGDKIHTFNFTTRYDF